jgi:hypothetical protein
MPSVAFVVLCLIVPGEIGDAACAIAIHSRSVCTGLRTVACGGVWSATAFVALKSLLRAGSWPGWAHGLGAAQPSAHSWATWPMGAATIKNIFHLGVAP